MSWATARVVARDNISLLSVIACLVGVWTDPLFFYIPYLDQEKMCVETDNKLKNIALVIRSLTDISFLVDIIYHIRKASKPTVVVEEQSITVATAVKWMLSWRFVFLDFVAILPIPQVLILYIFYNSKTFGVPKNGLALNFFVFIQYVPRIYAAFVVSKEYRKIWPIWCNATFYFFMYILTGYVFGGMWYFSTIQAIIMCIDNWSCEHLGECSSFYCSSSTPYSKMALKQISTCAVVRETEKGFETLYDDILKFGYVGNTEYRKKMVYFTWVGLKNLSNFGTSLNTSILLWDNVFAILVCGMGMILFAYLIGHMQNMMQYAVSAKEKTKVKQGIKDRELKVEKWMAKHDVQFTSKIKHKMRGDNIAHLGNTYCLPDSSVQKALFKNMLLKVPEFKTTASTALDMICVYLKPVIYTQKSFVFQAGEPLDSMLFITEGTVIIYTNDNNAESPPISRYVLQDGDVYGHKDLLSWASTSSTLSTQVSLENLPISTENVKCLTKIEGFALNAKDLKTALEKGDRDRTLQQISPV